MALYCTVTVNTKGLGDIASSLEYMMNACGTKDLKTIVRDGAGVVMDETKAIIQAKAKSHPRGQLAESIDAKVSVHSGDVSAEIGWKQTPIAGR